MSIFFPSSVSVARRHTAFPVSISSASSPKATSSALEGTFTAPLTIGGRLSEAASTVSVRPRPRGLCDKRVICDGAEMTTQLGRDRRHGHDATHKEVTQGV